MSSAGTRERRLRWSLLVAAATTAMVLAVEAVLYFRMEEYLVKEIDGDLQEVLKLSEAALKASGSEAEARSALAGLAGGEGTPLTLRAEAPWRILVGHLAGRTSEGVGYPFRVRSAGAVTATLYLKSHGRRLRHQQLLILWTTLAAGLASWGIAWAASGRLFGPLEEAVRRESAFASTAAHEPRTPLTALTGEMEVALGQPRSGEEYRAVLSSALEEVRRLTALVNHLLFLARADAGQEKLAMGEVDVKGLLRELEEAFGPLAEEKGLTLMVETPSALSLRGDRVRLRQALANLLDNAIRHTVAGEVRLSASRTDGGVRLAVSDTGPGIPEAERARLFERFRRGEGSPGSGLGLAIVTWVAEAHGGRVSVEGAPGRGSVFSLRVPG